MAARFVIIVAFEKVIAVAYSYPSFVSVGPLAPKSPSSRLNCLVEILRSWRASSRSLWAIDLVWGFLYRNKSRIFRSYSLAVFASPYPDVKSPFRTVIVEAVQVPFDISTNDNGHFSVFCTSMGFTSRPGTWPKLRTNKNRLPGKIQFSAREQLHQAQIQSALRGLGAMNQCLNLSFPFRNLPSPLKNLASSRMNILNSSSERLDFIVLTQ